MSHIASPAPFSGACADGLLTSFAIERGARHALFTDLKETFLSEKDLSAIRVWMEGGKRRSPLAPQCATGPLSQPSTVFRNLIFHCVGGADGYGPHCEGNEVSE